MKVKLLIYLFFYLSTLFKDNLTLGENLKKINLLQLDDEIFFRVKLLVYSGTEDPSWFISKKEIIHLEKLLSQNKFREKKSNRVMGYQGFLLSYENIKIVNVKGNPKAELFLLSTMNQNIPDQVTDHILEVISTGYEVKPEEEKFSIFFNPIKKTSVNINCENTPIRGPDTVPKYDPHNDDFGCFEEMQWDNNCYNYGTDVLTNTFAQPGRGSQHKWIVDTCDDVKRAALSDGLKWVGVEYPKDKHDKGHYIALLIWPDTNFHWVRLDSDGYWSHKPGGTEIKNKDNNGNPITDPSTQDFSPWTQFCGYFSIVPSEITIN